MGAVSLKFDSGYRRNPEADLKSKHIVQATLQTGRYPKSWRGSLGVQDLWCRPLYSTLPSF